MCVRLGRNAPRYSLTRLDVETRFFIRVSAPAAVVFKVGFEGLKAAAVLYRLSELSEPARGRRGEEAGQRGESSATHGLSSALMALITSLGRRGKEVGQGRAKPSAVSGGGGSLSTPGGGVSVRVSANRWAVEGWMGGGRWW